MNTPYDLTGRVALVTGSSRGIGRAIAMELGRAGARVVFHGSKTSAALDSAVAEARAAGIDGSAAVADLGKIEEVAALAGIQPDILVLNASVQSYGTAENFDPEEFDRQYHTNLRSSFLLVQQVLGAMKERRRGRIIAIGSVNEYRPAARLTIYSTGKSALENLMRNLAAAYAEFGITANTVAPGVIATDRNAEALRNPELVAKLHAAIPARRFGTPEDCAGIVRLLASDAGSYINGAEIPVTGGMHL